MPAVPRPDTYGTRRVRAPEPAVTSDPGGDGNHSRVGRLDGGVPGHPGTARNRCGEHGARRPEPGRGRPVRREHEQHRPDEPEEPASRGRPHEEHR
ncbi:hypothetical protein AN218_32795 [Streptomyces nanshensis]|uniref:Uncharacterized protein n=1 Tax=Streptomyces nanshensis TaxID=518642 RepID=A0A1E7KGK6_9ACTN|nr:hypothetical protein AN218_32795 [Streptomyces nanshensis]